MNQGTHRAGDRDAVIELDRTGTGQVTIGGSVVPINGQGNVDYGRQQARDVVVAHAQSNEVAVEVEVREPDAQMRLRVTEAGQVSVLPVEPAPAPAAAPAPAPAPAAAEPVTPWTPDRTPAAPAHQEVETDPASAPWQADAPEPSPVLPVQHQEPQHDVSAPVEEAAPVDPELAEEEARPATEGWRGTMNGLGLKIAPGAGELEARRRAFHERKAADAERAQQEADQLTRRRAREAADRSVRSRIQTDLPESVTILVANQKGGQRKTTSTYCLGATFGSIRGGYVVAWDANETMGTLGYRSQKGVRSQTVVDLLEDASERFGTVEGSRFGVLNPYLRGQGDSHFEVLASDEDAKRQDIIGGDEFKKVHEILSRFYRVVLVDTGNNIRTGHLLAALDASHQLVVPVTASRDGVLGARRTMEAFTNAGYGDLVKSAVVLLHDLEPAATADAKYLETVQSIADELAPLVAAVVPIPYDSHLSDGGEIDYAAVAESTRVSYRGAAAEIMDQLAAKFFGGEAR